MGDRKYEKGQTVTIENKHFNKSIEGTVTHVVEKEDRIVVETKEFAVNFGIRTGLELYAPEYIKWRVVQ